ncbi:MAG: response regulator [Planctomycetota bacterium]|nr:response regulator [Planctomycetota bacterium]
MSGLQDEDTAIQCVQEGAQDYLVKSRLSTESIVRAVKDAIQRHRIQSGIRKAKQEFDSGEFRARSGPPAEKRAAGQDPVGGATGELSLEQADIVSFANRLGIIFRTCKTADTVSATVVSLQLRGIVQSFIALEPNGGDVIAVIKKALEREGISALDMDTLPICFEFFSMVVSKYRQ